MLLPDFSSQREKEKYFRSLNDEQKIDALNEMVDISEHIVFLGGADVSTESGIPDFRSKNGLYHKKDKRFSMYKPEYLLSYDCLNKKPAVFFDYFRKNLDCRSIEPNDAHRKLFQMEQRADLVFHDSIGKIMNQIEI
ncbi:Sir2 family NAD-dependent protein deacetylase [Butyrivibrio sp. AD3002]|uniref:Sir2 family NAD-dependent protein deacetylase n=1 Tax=Butyrivibrio sp. AD3002 TaxID=1280670 RepID=UPI0003B411D7|nr:Sir2 family NAD-dependent protein deacetylase [Butyrivibrio sp. AD3002]